MKYLLVMFLLLEVPPVPASAQTTPGDKLSAELQKARDKLSRSNDPVGRTKAQINISKLLLNSAMDAAKNSDFARLDQAIIQYRDAIRDAGETMVKSGRNANKKTAGFKDLEMSLQKNMRQLNDIADMVDYDHRDAVEKAKTEASGIHDEMIKAIFFGGKNGSAAPR